MDKKIGRELGHDIFEDKKGNHYFLLGESLDIKIIIRWANQNDKQLDDKYVVGDAYDKTVFPELYDTPIQSFDDPRLRDTKEQLADMREGNDIGEKDATKVSGFKLKAQYFLVTMPGKVDKILYPKFLKEKNEGPRIAKVYVAHEKGNPKAKMLTLQYEHSHVIIKYHTSFQAEYGSGGLGGYAACHWFCWAPEGSEPYITKNGEMSKCGLPHCNIKSIPANSRKDMARAMLYISKEDLATRIEIFENGEDLSTEWTVKEFFKNNPSLKETVGSCKSFSQVPGAALAHKIMSKCTSTDYTRLRLKREWTKEFMKKWWDHPLIFNNRSIVYIYDKLGQSGKTKWKEWLVQELGYRGLCIDNRQSIIYDGEVITNPNYKRFPLLDLDGIREYKNSNGSVFKDLAYQVLNEFDGNTHDIKCSLETLIMDYTRCGGKPGIETCDFLECFKNCSLTSRKYNTVGFTWAANDEKYTRVIILSNQPPFLGWWREEGDEYEFEPTFTEDRLVVFELADSGYENCDDGYPDRDIKKLSREEVNRRWKPKHPGTMQKDHIHSAPLEGYDGAAKGIPIENIMEK